MIMSGELRMITGFPRMGTNAAVIDNPKARLIETEGRVRAHHRGHPS